MADYICQPLCKSRALNLMKVKICVTGMKLADRALEVNLSFPGLSWVFEFIFDVGLNSI